MKYSRKAKSNIRSKRRKLSKRNKSSVRRKTRTRVLRRKFSKNIAKTSKRLVGGKRRQRKKRKNIKRTYKIRKVQRGGDNGILSTNLDEYNIWYDGVYDITITDHNGQPMTDQARLDKYVTDNEAIFLGEDITQGAFYKQIYDILQQLILSSAQNKTLLGLFRHTDSDGTTFEKNDIIDFPMDIERVQRMLRISKDSKYENNELDVIFCDYKDIRYKAIPLSKLDDIKDNLSKNYVDEFKLKQGNNEDKTFSTICPTGRGFYSAITFDYQLVLPKKTENGDNLINIKKALDMIYQSFGGEQLVEIEDKKFYKTKNELVVIISIDDTKISFMRFPIIHLDIGNLDIDIGVKVKTEPDKVWISDTSQITDVLQKSQIEPEYLEYVVMAPDILGVTSKKPNLVHLFNTIEDNINKLNNTLNDPSGSHIRESINLIPTEFWHIHVCYNDYPIPPAAPVPTTPVPATPVPAAPVPVPAATAATTPATPTVAATAAAPTQPSNNMYLVCHSKYELSSELSLFNKTLEDMSHLSNPTTINFPNEKSTRYPSPTTLTTEHMKNHNYLVVLNEKKMVFYNFIKYDKGMISTFAGKNFIDLNYHNIDGYADIVNIVNRGGRRKEIEQCMACTTPWKDTIKKWIEEDPQTKKDSHFAMFVEWFLNREGLSDLAKDEKNKTIVQMLFKEFVTGN